MCAKTISSSKKRILITGAGSGFGEGVALGLSKKGHEVIATVQIWPQATKLREQAEELGLKNLRVEKLDILDCFDVEHAIKEFDIDILVNNAAISFTGPISEIPLELVQRTFDTNVFAALNLTQQFVRKFVDEKRPGKIVFISSVAGLFGGAGYGAYTASKHAIEAIAETMQKELEKYRIKVQTINPSAYRTGFNDTMTESAFYWMDDAVNFTKRAEMKKLMAHVLGKQKDPQEAIDAMISIIPADSGMFRNVIPISFVPAMQERQAEAWRNKI